MSIVKPAGLGSRTGLQVATIVVCMITALLIVILPAFLIQPFEAQTQRDLAISFFLRRWSPYLTLILAVVVVALCVSLWRRAPRWWRKTLLSLSLILTVAAAWFARQNHFEWMFHPISNESYARIPEADFVADTDMVLAVTINGEAAAYPVRQLAYHHLVQDVVGGVPIVATY